MLDLFEPLLLYPLILVLLLLQVDLDRWIQSFLDPLAMPFILTPHKGFDIPMLLFLHHVEYFLGSVFHSHFVLVGHLDVALDTVDELLDQRVGSLVVLVAATHLHHVFGEFTFFRLVSVVYSAFVDLEFLLLVKANRAASGADQRG